MYNLNIFANKALLHAFNSVLHIFEVNKLTMQSTKYVLISLNEVFEMLGDRIKAVKRLKTSNRQKQTTEISCNVNTILN